jgi:hypothetical protein
MTKFKSDKVQPFKNGDIVEHKDGYRGWYKVKDYHDPATNFLTHFCHAFTDEPAFGALCSEKTFRKVDPKYIFKVGEKVIRTGDTVPNVVKGETYTVSRVWNYGQFQVEGQKIWYFANNFEKVEPMFEVGDWVVPKDKNVPNKNLCKPHKVRWVSEDGSVINLEIKGHHPEPTVFAKYFELHAKAEKPLEKVKSPLDGYNP